MRQPAWRRIAQLAASIGNWRDLANEWRLRSLRPYKSPEQISFPLDREKLSHTIIRWPAQSPWPGARPFGGDLRVGFRRFVTVQDLDIEQPYPGVVFFQVQFRDRTFNVAADFRDYPDVIQTEALHRSAIYFKM